MSNYKEGQVITYRPDDEAYNVREMGGLRRAAHFYTNKLGQEFTLLLFLSLAYQGFIGIFVGVRAIRYLPVLNWLSQDVPALNVLGLICGVVLGLIFQSLLIAGAAQFAWVYRPDRLRNQLMKSSNWWWLIGIMLLVVIVLDFLMIFMGITGTVNLGEGLRKTGTDNMTLVVNVLIMALALLTLLQCAVTMRTTTVDYNRKLVEEHLQTIGEELFLGSGENLKEQAEATWRTINVDPSRFVPLQDAVINQIAASHPTMFNSGIGGDTWAYDTSGNTLVALTPDLHQALSSSRGRAGSFSNQDMKQLYQLGPEDLARLISFNFDTMGKPRIVDATDPNRAPEFIFHPPNFDKVLPKSAPAPKATARQIDANQVDPLGQWFADGESFWQSLPKNEKIPFAAALKQLYQKQRGYAFDSSVGVNIWDEFSARELPFYYEQWKKQTQRR